MSEALSMRPVAGPGLDYLVSVAASPPDQTGKPALDGRRGVKEIEGFFIGHLLKVMRQTVPKGLFGSPASEQFYYFFDQEIGRLAAESGSFGLAAMLEADLREKGLMATDKNGSSSTAAPPIQGPNESVMPSASIGSHTKKG